MLIIDIVMVYGHCSRFLDGNHRYSHGLPFFMLIIDIVMVYGHCSRFLDGNHRYSHGLR